MAYFWSDTDVTDGKKIRMLRPELPFPFEKMISLDDCKDCVAAVFVFLLCNVSKEVEIRSPRPFESASN